MDWTKWAQDSEHKLKHIARYVCHIASMAPWVTRRRRASWACWNLEAASSSRCTGPRADLGAKLRCGDFGVNDSKVCNVGNYSNNQPPILDGLYHPFMVIRGMVYYCYTNIKPNIVDPENHQRFIMIDQHHISTMINIMINVVE